MLALLLAVVLDVVNVDALAITSEAPNLKTGAGVANFAASVATGTPGAFTSDTELSLCLPKTKGGDGAIAPPALKPKVKANASVCVELEEAD